MSSDISGDMEDINHLIASDVLQAGFQRLFYCYMNFFSKPDGNCLYNVALSPEPSCS
jgi:hypothetical protein